MFVQAIIKATDFTRPVHSIARYFGATKVQPGAATIFLINDQGWALTCKHVVENMIAGNQLHAQAIEFRAKRAAIPKGRRSKELHRALEEKYRYTSKSVFELKHRFVDCPEPVSSVHHFLHPSLDIALLRFDGFSSMPCTSFPIFASDSEQLRQGTSLCRLGFPFPEFTNYEYDSHADTIVWNTSGIPSTPQFPLEGMVTRHLSDSTRTIVGFELSTPGLRGQSGGPVFDSSGRIWGVQASTAHLDLDFDVDQEVYRGNESRRVKNHPFLHVGRCVHVEPIKAFMRLHNVLFQEG